jgi:hypothetical protein
MLAYRADEDAFSQIERHVDQYLAHWFTLLENKLTVPTFESLDGYEFATRDQRNRSAIFNPEVDAVWSQMDRLLGEETSAELQEILRTQDVAII